MSTDVPTEHQTSAYSKVHSNFSRLVQVFVKRHTCLNIYTVMISAAEIVDSREKPSPELPAIGIKDFEPNGSLEQSAQIKQSLCEIKEIISYKKVKPLNTLSKAIWKPELNLAEVTHQTGSHWSYMGHKEGERLYIYPEEALYLLETGAIEILFNGVSMSVQRAYSVIFEKEHNFSIEKYRVYSLLNNHGYKVVRHSPKNTVTKYEKNIDVHKIGIKLKSYNNIANTKKRQADSEEQFLSNNKKQKVIKEFPVDYDTAEDKTDILKKIRVIQPFSEKSNTALMFDYDVYSDMDEKHSFKKSCLQLPNYRVIIHRGEDPMLDINELCKLTNKYEDEVPVVHAVVFCDCITFYKINPVIVPDSND